MTTAPFDQSRRKLWDGTSIPPHCICVDAVDPLIQALKDQDEWTREYAAEHLGKLNDTRAVDPLILALKDNDSLVRLNAVEALGNLNDSRAVDPLTKVLNDVNEEKDVQDAAAEVLKKLGKTITQTAQ